jgi:hypothetical protein
MPLGCLIDKKMLSKKGSFEKPHFSLTAATRGLAVPLIEAYKIGDKKTN